MNPAKPPKQLWLSKLPFYDGIRNRGSNLGPGSRGFLKSLSIVTVCFGVSKVFSSVATVIVARYLGKFSFGEAQIILLMSQVLSMGMLFGLHVSLMRYGSGKENPAPEVSTSIYFAGFGAVVFAGLTWLLREPLGRWLDLDDYKIGWAINLGVLFTAYAIFTSVYQALGLFKQRGIIEIVFAFLLLPGLAAGHLLTGGGYETLLIAYAIAYAVSMPFLLWRVRHMLSPKHLFADNTREMLTYGGFSVLSNIGFILTFVIQPMQINWAQGEAQVGVFRLYCASSINMATFATGIFYVVFFPKVSASLDRLGVWRRMTRAWFKAAVPLLTLFAGVQAVTIWLAGSDYPFLWSQIALFSIASTLITIQATYGQILAAQGVQGMRWGLALSSLSGAVNFTLTYLLVPRFGLTGAILALIANFAITLVATLALRDRLLKPGHPDDQSPVLTA